MKLTREQVARRKVEYNIAAKRSYLADGMVQEAEQAEKRLQLWQRVLRHRNIDNRAKT